MEEIPVEYISELPEVQPREALNDDKVAEYGDLMKEGVKFPPLVVFAVGEKVFVLADGFHRFRAAQRAALPGISCDIRQGSVREAQLFALHANATHGLPLSPKEKQNAARKLLKDDEWQFWTDGAIARWIGVSPMTIGRWRQEWCPEHYNNDRVRICADRRVMRTGGIGKNKTKAVVALRTAPAEPGNEEDGAGDKTANGELYTWESAGQDERGRDLWELSAVDTDYEGVLNTTNDNIEWATRTWNPITGCRTDCPYCYARNIADSKRFSRIYPKGFDPCFHRSRIEAPISHKPSNPDDIRSTLLFTCSMADMFGPWVPDKWIRQVVDTIEAAPWWRFIVLTKYPERMTDEQWRDWPRNAWIGATVVSPDRIAPTEAAFKKITAPVKFVSCEPLASETPELHLNRIDLFDWIIIGGRSAANGLKEDHPRTEVVESLLKQAREAGKAVYRDS